MNTSSQTIHDIPRQDLLAMLLETVWYSGNRREFDRQGYSMEVQEETAIRDVNYRDRPLFATPEEAIIHYWRRNFHDGIVRFPDGMTIEKLEELQTELDQYIGTPKCMDCKWKLGSDITNNCGCTGKADHGKYKQAIARARELQKLLEATH